MLWWGLTGGIATGKSTVTQQLRSLGVSIIDADDIARDVVSPGTTGLSQVIQAFGPEALKLDGGLDRKKLGSLVFGDPKKIAQLENILHPLIRDEVERRRSDLESTGCRLAMYDVPLLYEKDLVGHFDKVIVVYSTPLQQRERLKKRNPEWSTEDIERRLASQLSIETKRARADHVIENLSTLKDLETAVDTFYRSHLDLKDVSHQPQL